MSVAEPQPNPETVAALLDTTGRMADAESARTDALDRKAATVATFAAALGAFTSVFGITSVERFHAWWSLCPFVATLMALVGSLVSAVAVLWPREYATLAT